MEKLAYILYPTGIEYAKSIVKQTEDHLYPGAIFADNCIALRQMLLALEIANRESAWEDSALLDLFLRREWQLTEGDFADYLATRDRTLWIRKHANVKPGPHWRAPE